MVKKVWTLVLNRNTYIKLYIKLMKKSFIYKFLVEHKEILTLKHFHNLNRNTFSLTDLVFDVDKDKLMLFKF